MPAPTPPITNQRMFHGTIRAAALADQLCARFSDRQHRTSIRHAAEGSAVVQIGSKHGTPVTVTLADVAGGVLVSMSRDRDWLDRSADAGEMLERAASNPFSLLAMVPDVLGELREEGVAPRIWDAINELMALSRSLAGEVHAPANPIVCPYCATVNPPDQKDCQSCGAPLPVQLPRVCPKCGRAHTSDALFCQSCGTRLVEG